MKIRFFIIIGIIYILGSCKKEAKAPVLINTVSSVGSTADFTITPTNINYSVGTTWVYNIISVNKEYDLFNPNNPQITISNSNVTVKVVRDSLISNLIRGKILQYSAPRLDGINTYIREVMYYDSVDTKWHDILYEKYNGGTESVNCFGINLPLTANSKWENTHASHPSAGIDSCFALGFENTSCGLGIIKCIKFNNKPINGVQNTYWYNNIYGRVRAETSITEGVNQIVTVKTSTIALTSFNL